MYGKKYFLCMCNFSRFKIRGGKMYGYDENYSRPQENRKFRASFLELVKKQENKITNRFAQRSIKIDVPSILRERARNNNNTRNFRLEEPEGLESKAYAENLTSPSPPPLPPRSFETKRRRGGKREEDSKRREEGRRRRIRIHYKRERWR